MYAPDKWEILSEINSVGCVTIVSLIFGRKIAGVDGPVVYVRSLTLLFYLFVWLFQLISCMAVSTNNGNHMSCTLGFFSATVIYTLARISLSLYFIEKIYIISVPKTPRLRSPIYHVGIILLLPYIGIMVLMAIYKTVEINPEDDYHCTIGYSLEASVPALCYDFITMAITTSMFMKLYFYPNAGQRTSRQSSTLILMAKRNILASTVPCITAAINYLIMIGLQGRERGLVALSISTLVIILITFGDLTIVALVLHWVTSYYGEIPMVEKVLQPVTNTDKPIKLEIKQHQEVVVLTELSSARNKASSA